MHDLFARSKPFVLCLAAYALLLMTAGCTIHIGFGATPTPATPTRAAVVLRPTFTVTPVSQEQPEAPTATPAPLAPVDQPPPETATPAPPAATPTPAVPMVLATTNVNVRRGPGTVYPVVGAAKSGDAYPIKGKNPAGDWWQIDYSGRDGWVYARLVQSQGNVGDIQVAANIPAPPPPTATPVPPPTAVPQPVAPPAPAAPQYEWMLVKSGVVAAPNCGVVHFDGQVRYADGSAQNGVCVHIAFYGPRSTKCSGCGGTGNGNWSFSPFGSQSPPSGVPVEIYLVSCPSNLPPDGKTYNEGESSPSPVSDKFTATITDKCQTGQWTNIIFKKTR